MKKNMKRTLVLVATGLMVLGSAVTSLAGTRTDGVKGEWKKDHIGWWWQNEDGSYLHNGQYWLDGNGDGSAECYWFDERGYMIENFITADGLTFNADGALEKNGVVQTRQVVKKAEVVQNTDNSGSGMGWRKDHKGWWYATNHAGTSWHSNGWHWVDGNNDGVSECYYFDANGYMIANTTTPDGYQVNADGAWIENGIVKTNTVVSNNQNVTTEVKQETVVENIKNTYNEYGVSNIALDMLHSTREENDAKYEVERVREDSSVLVAVYYKNGFWVRYAEASSGSYKSVGISDGNDKRLFKYYDEGIKNQKDAEKHLIATGIWEYGWGHGNTVGADNDACHINFGDDSLLWNHFGKTTKSSILLR